jgi:hypothetical protein
VRAQQDRGSAGHVGDVINEHHAQGLEVVHHEAIVDDFVVAKDRWFEDADHPVRGLDGLFHSGAGAARRRQNYLVDTHHSSLAMSSFHECLG